jgi:anti-sigma factor ChrR (cupin superfamily)
MDHENWLELADIYAAGALDGDDLAQFQAHLATGCTFCQARIRENDEALAAIPTSVQSAAPAPSVKASLFQRIDSEKPGLVYIHASEGSWIEAEPGVFAKILNIDTERRRVTALVRMAPGSRYADHRHLGTEEVLVLEGSCYCGGRLLRKGDYHRAEPGSIHLDTRTDEGSFMLVTAPLQNELLSP